MGRAIRRRKLALAPRMLKVRCAVWRHLGLLLHPSDGSTPAASCPIEGAHSAGYLLTQGSGSKLLSYWRCQHHPSVTEYSKAGLRMLPSSAAQPLCAASHQATCRGTSTTAVVAPPPKRNLVIVESPAKVKKLQRYLGSDYKVGCWQLHCPGRGDVPVSLAPIMRSQPLGRRLLQPMATSVTCRQTWHPSGWLATFRCSGR